MSSVPGNKRTYPENSAFPMDDGEGEGESDFGQNMMGYKRKKTNSKLVIHQAKFQVVPIPEEEIAANESLEAFHNFCLVHYPTYNEDFKARYGVTASFTDISRDLNMQTAFSLYEENDPRFVEHIHSRFE